MVTRLCIYQFHEDDPRALSEVRRAVEGNVVQKRKIIVPYLTILDDALGAKDGESCNRKPHKEVRQSNSG